MTALGIAIGVVGALVAAWIGGRLQRSTNREHLSLQLQIDNAAKFMAALEQFSVGYAQSNMPGVEALSTTERDVPIFLALMQLRAAAAAVEIVGPDELHELVGKMVAKGVDAFDHGPDGLKAFTELNGLAEEFMAEAQKLRPAGRQKNGRKWLRRKAASPPSTDIPPGD